MHNLEFNPDDAFTSAHEDVTAAHTLVVIASAGLVCKVGVAVLLQTS